MPDIKFLVQISKEINKDAKILKRTSVILCVFSFLLIVFYICWSIYITFFVSKVKYPYMCFEKYYTCADFISRNNMEMMFLYCKNNRNVILKELLNEHGELCKNYVYSFDNNSIFIKNPDFKDQ